MHKDTRRQKLTQVPSTESDPLAEKANLKGTHITTDTPRQWKDDKPDACG